MPKLAGSASPSQKRFLPFFGDIAQRQIGQLGCSLIAPLYFPLICR